MKKTTLITLIAALFVAFSSGFAATKGQEKQFSDGDKNGDGSLSKEEFVAVRGSIMAAAAKKNDREFDAAKVGERLGKRFSSLDTDGDGKLSSDEFYASFVKKDGDKKKKKDS